MPPVAATYLRTSSLSARQLTLDPTTLLAQIGVEQLRSNAMQLRNISDVTGGILGDSNVDGMVDFDDIAPFIGFLANGNFQFQSDIDGNQVVDFDDIAGFIAILAGP